MADVPIQSIPIVQPICGISTTMTTILLETAANHPVEEGRMKDHLSIVVAVLDPVKPLKDPIHKPITHLKPNQ